MKVIVSGVAGFIGSHLADALLADGHTVIGVDDLSAGKLANIENALKNQRFVFLQKSITDFYDKFYPASFAGADVMFHLAASKKVVCLNNPHRDFFVNGWGTVNLFHVAREAGIRKFIYASTGSVYGEKEGLITEESFTVPVSFYGASKCAADRYLELRNSQFGDEIAIMRLFHVYGPRQESAPGKGGVIAITCERLLQRLPAIIFGDGSQVRVFTYVGDVIRAFVHAWENDLIGVYNVTSGEQVTVGEAVMKLGKYASFGFVEYQPWQVGDIRNFRVSNYKLCSTGFKFETPFEIGLQHTWEWYKRNVQTDL